MNDPIERIKATGKDLSIGVKSSVQGEKLIFDLSRGAFSIVTEGKTENEGKRWGRC